MILHIHSDRFFLSVANIRSRVGGHFFLSDNPNKPEQAKPNGAIHSIYNILKNIMGLAVETEIEATYDNPLEAKPI